MSLPFPSTPSRIAIIGAGVAGLTAAFTIRRSRPDIHVELFEAADKVGGAVQTEFIDGCLIERGADMFATDPPAGMELCRELGIEDQLMTPLATARGAAIVQNGKLVKIPEGFVLMRPTQLWPMMTTPLLSIRGKLRLLAERFVKPRGSIEDESIESFVTRRLGRETLDRIVQPLVGGIYTGDVAKLSMAATMPQFWEMERRDGSLFRATVRRGREGADATEKTSAGARYEKFRSFPHGMSQLMTTLAAQLPPERLHLSTRVESIRKVDSQWQIDAPKFSGDSRFDHVILAVPAKPAASMLQDSVPQASHMLRSIPFASSAVVVMVVPEDSIHVPMPIAGFIVPIRERRLIIAVSFTGDKFAGRTPPGLRLLRVFIGGMLQPELNALDDDSLVRLATAELAELLRYDGRASLARVVRWNEAMPQYHLGHRSLVSRLEKVISEQGGLSIIGNSLHGVGIAPTIAQARRVARSIIEADVAAPTQP